MISALTDPKKIASHLRREGIWIYVGKDLNRFHAFRKGLSEKLIHTSPAQFREFTTSNRRAFVQWTEEAHLKYGHNLTHWLSDTFSSDPYRSNLFLHFMNLAWFRAILGRYPEKDIIFVAESRALLLIVDVIARSLFNPSILVMKQFIPDEIEGVRRCFVMYVKMPKNRWSEIEKAGQLSPKGNALWEKLRTECAEKYLRRLLFKKNKIKNNGKP